jgi:hypothetical protein
MPGMNFSSLRGEGGGVHAVVNSRPLCGVFLGKRGRHKHVNVPHVDLQELFKSLL